MNKKITVKPEWLKTAEEANIVEGGCMNICIYRDIFLDDGREDGFFSEGECNFDNLTDLRLPAETLYKWWTETCSADYENMSFLEWYTEEYIADDTDGLPTWLSDRGYTFRKSEEYDEVIAMKEE